MSLKSTLVFSLIFVNVSVLAAPTASTTPTDKLNLSAGVSYENSDNISLSPVNKIDDSIIHELLGVDYQKQSSTLTAHLSLNADHQTYKNNSFPAQTAAYLDSLTRSA